jgi:hypothetical protein
LLDSSSRLVRASFVAAVGAALLATSGTAHARNPEDVFRGQIITSARSIPLSSKSKGAYIATLRKLKTTRFQEDRQKKQWKVYFAAFFRKPLNSLEVTIKIFDVSGGGQRLLATFEQYMDKRGASSLTSQMTLQREQFGVNKNLMMVMESRGKVLAAARFAIVGEGEKYKGKVDFTEEESQATDEN